MRTDRQCLCEYRDVVACGEKPVADKVKAGYSGAEVNPLGFREQVNSREQFIWDAVRGILEVGLGLSQGATQHTLGKRLYTQWVYSHVSKKPLTWSFSQYSIQQQK